MARIARHRQTAGPSPATVGTWSALLGKRRGQRGKRTCVLNCIGNCSDYLLRRHTLVLVCGGSAKLPYIPRECRRAVARVMDMEQARLLLSTLDVREQLITKLAVLAGMRTDEILRPEVSRLEAKYPDIRQRVVSWRSGHAKDGAVGVRHPVGSFVRIDYGVKILSLDTSPDAWVFPSEAKTPMSKDDCRRRCFLPKVKLRGWIGRASR